MTLEQIIGLIVVAAIIAISIHRGRNREAAPVQGSPSRPITRAPSTPTDTGVIRTWGYQLQNLDLRRAAECPFDLIVIDPSRDGSDDGTLSAADVALLKTKPDGTRRRILAYLSIGEAESYRGYWQASWKREKPAWLLAENPEWKENYAVCYWDPGWQAIMCGTAHSRLERILAAGFDGVYLDKCDVYEDMRHRRMAEAKARPDLEADMVAFVARISAHAKRARPDFLVVMQNAEALLDDASLRASLDGVGKEELVYGIDGSDTRNKQAEIDWSRGQLDMMKRDGKLVFVIEYLNSQSKIDDATKTIRAFDYVLYVSDKSRDLARLNYVTIEA